MDACDEKSYPEEAKSARCQPVHVGFVGDVFAAPCALVNVQEEVDEDENKAADVQVEALGLQTLVFLDEPDLLARNRRHV